ncbi:MAG: hypothetical protein K2M53_03570 [Muribaculaceae bacterium]|nr:hypothetical protein [Muribaculaceae bacterium]
MKKLVSFITLCLIIISGSAVYGQSIGKQLKNEKKAIEARVKEIQKEGWKDMGNDGLAIEISRHFAKKSANPNLLELAGDSKPSTTKNLGKAAIITAVINEYAQYCGGMVKGRITSDLRDVNEEQADNMVAAYERILVKELKNEIKPSYFLVKETSGPKPYIVRGIFLVDEDAVERASQRALKEAAEDAGIAYDYANKISDFINEGIKNQ